MKSSATLSSLRGVALALLSVMAVPAASAETITLASGEVLIGRVTQIDADSIRVEVGYPEQKSVTLAKTELSKGFLYDLLVRESDPDSADDHMALAQAGRELGLLGHAIAEYREAGRLDRSLLEQTEAEVKSLREIIAAGMLADIEQDLAEENKAAARLNLEVLILRFGDTPAATKGRDLRHIINSQVMEAEARPETPPAEISRAIKKVEKLEKQAERSTKGKENPVIRTSRERKAREIALKKLEQAWSLVVDLQGPKVRDPKYTDSLNQTRNRLRNKLNRLYLALGTYYVGKLAIPRAEGLNVRACELNADTQSCIRLQDLIVQARISNGTLVR